MKKILILAFTLLAVGCTDDYVNCANACKISGLQMKECVSSDTLSSVKSCKCGEVLSK